MGPHLVDRAFTWGTRATRWNVTPVAFQLPGDVEVAVKAAAGLLQGRRPVTESPLSGSWTNG